MKSNIKALVLYSNGLDSRLVIKLLKEQLSSKNIFALYFVLPFGSKYPNKIPAKEFCEREKINFVEMDVTKGKLLQDYVNMIKTPRYGYGKALNPCIDCKIWMLKKAKQYAKKNNIQIIATGEVLHQRPMSQHKNSLKAIEKSAGLKKKILRPLSAKLLGPTDYDHLIDTKKLLDIQGRTRQKQIELSKKYNIDYPTPAGGCLLCEKSFTKKIKPLLKKKKTKNLELEIELSKFGRHFEDNAIILGKDKKENDKLLFLYKKFKKGYLIIPLIPGPSAYVKNKNNIKKAKDLINKYSKNKITRFKVQSPE